MGNWQLLSRKLFGSEKNEECNNRKKNLRKKFENSKSEKKYLIHA